jgi:uncharacterized protein (TIGR02598 family)
MNNTTQRKTDGFTLIEVCVALGIAAICILTLQQVIPTSLKVANNASDQSAASAMMSAISQDLRNTPAGQNTSPGFGITLPVDATNASTLISTNLYLAADGVGVNSPSQARYAATVWMSNAASATVTSLTTARIKVYWPPTGNTQGSVETVTSFNRQFQRGGAYVATKVATNSGSTSGSGYNGGSSSGGSCNNGGYNGGSSSGSGCDNGGNNGGSSSGGGCNGGNPRGGNGCDSGGCGSQQNNGCGQNK